MFEIWIDENGYYSTEYKDIIVEVKDMPTDITDGRHLKAYKFNPETQLLEVDEVKLAEIKAAIENEIKMPTESERLADLESAFLELSMMMLGGEQLW